MESFQDTIYKIAEGVIFKRQSAYTVVIKMDSDIMHSIKGLSQGIWCRIDGKQTVNQIIEKTIKEDAIPLPFQDRFRKDSLAFISKLLNLELLSRRE